MTNIITAAIIKGGTGKSSTVAALAQAAAHRGRNVLCVDLDAQANLSSFIGADTRNPGSYDLLNGADPASTIQRTAQAGIACIAASPDLATEKTTPASAMRLQKALEPIQDAFDWIFIDTPPLMGEVTFNALQACTGLIIPLETDNSSLNGLFQIAGIANQIRRSNPDMRILGTVLTRYDSRPKLNRYLKDLIADKGKELGIPFLLAIRSGIAIREAQALRKSLFDYAPDSKPALDYMELFNLIAAAR